MKQIIFALSGLILSFSSIAQVKKAVLKSSNAVCEECKDFLEARMVREEGVLGINVNYSKKTITVSWNGSKTNIEEIKAAIANFGFDADEITADESAYKRLPKCCKRPEVKPAPPKPGKN